MYKIKFKLPLKARLQIYHSFVQSHINYCSLVWGFTAKTHINSIFTVQKKAMRAIMTGYVNYFYKDGNIPTHTKPSFEKHNILTVHSIIAKNAMCFMHRRNIFPESLPPSVVNTIPENIPTMGTDHTSYATWLESYDKPIYRPSLFFKGPLLATTVEYSTTLNLSAYRSYKTHAIIAKRTMIKSQSLGNSDEWPNFLLHNIPGLRRSNRNRELTITS